MAKHHQQSDRKQAKQTQAREVLGGREESSRMKTVLCGCAMLLVSVLSFGPIQFESPGPYVPPVDLLAPAFAEPKASPTPQGPRGPRMSANEASASGALKTFERSKTEGRPEHAGLRENCEAMDDQFDRAACEQRRRLSGGPEKMGK